MPVFADGIFIGGVVGLQLLTPRWIILDFVCWLLHRASDERAFS